MRKLSFVLILLIFLTSFAFEFNFLTSMVKASVYPQTASIDVDASKIVKHVNKLAYGVNIFVPWLQPIYFTDGNMISNSGFEGNNTSDYYWPDHWGTNTYIHSRDSTTKVSGNYSQKIQITSFTNGNVGIKQVGYIIEQGHTYKISFYAKQNGTSGKIAVGLDMSRDPWSNLANTQVTITNNWKNYTVYVVSKQTEMGSVYIKFSEVGTIWIDNFTMNDLNATGQSFEPNALNKIKELGATIIRFPGGSYADTYHWKDSIDPNIKAVFGFDQFMKLCDALNTDALVTVNYGTGTVQEAADWVEYANAPNDGLHYWAALRAANGHPQPYNVKYWEIGNEVYGSWETGHTDVTTYANDFIKYSNAMKAVDPSIQIGAVAPETAGTIAASDTTKVWTNELLRIAGNYIDFFEHHRYYPRYTSMNPQPSSQEIYYAVMTASKDLNNRQIEFMNLTAQLVPQKAGKIPIVFSEYNALYDDNISRGATLEAGLLVADILRYSVNQDFISQAEIHDLVYDPSTMSTLINNWIDLTTKPTGYAFEMFTNHFGDDLINTTVISPTFNTTKKFTFIPPMNGVPYLEVTASLKDNKLYLLVINKHISDDITASINLKGFDAQQNANVYTLNGPSTDANNEVNANTVRIVSSSITDVSNTFTYTFPAHSVTSIELAKSAITTTQTTSGQTTTTTQSGGGGGGGNGGGGVVSSITTTTATTKTSASSTTISVPTSTTTQTTVSVITNQGGISEVSIVTISKSNDTTQILSNGVIATTQENITTSNNSISIQNGSNYSLIQVLPDQALKMANSTYTLTKIENIELVSENNLVYYSVIGTRNVKLFYLISINMPVKMKINASEFNKVISVEKPWWSFLVF